MIYLSKAKLFFRFPRKNLQAAQSALLHHQTEYKGIHRMLPTHYICQGISTNQTQTVLNQQIELYSSII